MNNMDIAGEDNKCRYEAKVVTRGNCMMCGKKLDEGLFFCKECEAKIAKEIDHMKENIPRTSPWESLNPPPKIEPTRYYVRVKFNYKFFNGIPVKTDRLYRTYKDVVMGPVPGCVEGMICIIDINGTSHEWNKEAIDEIKVYPQLEKVKEEEENE